MASYLSKVAYFNIPHMHLAHVYCGQTAEWIKMPLGTEVQAASAQATLC